MKGTGKLNHCGCEKPNQKKSYKKSNKHTGGKKKSRKKTRKCPYDKVVIKKSTRSGKKKMAVFTNSDSSRKKTTHFGAAGMSDYTKHKDKARKSRYLARHKKRENWNNCSSAGALSRWILWGEPTLSSSIKKFKQKFNLN